MTTRRFSRRPFPVSVLLSALLPALLSVVLSTSPLAAGQAAAGGEFASRVLDPVAWLAGTWVANQPDGKGGTEAVEATYRWLGHGRALAFTVRKITPGGAKTLSEGMYWWNPGPRRIDLLEVDARGGVIEAKVSASPTGVSLDASYTSVEGRKQARQVDLDRRSQDLFTYSGQVQRGRTWVETEALEYRRVLAR